MLPPWLEPDRNNLQKLLPQLNLPSLRSKTTTTATTMTEAVTTTTTRKENKLEEKQE
jgi:hypothetical protein